MTVSILQVSALLIIPVIIHNVLRDKAIARWFSPVVVCFILGICSGTFLQHLIIKPVSSAIQDSVIILAIPMLLMSSNFMKWLPRARSVLFSFAISCISVIIGVVAAFFAFRGKTEYAWLVSSMFLAGFTGTIANANAVGIAKNCPEDLMLLVNLGDLMTGAVYLVILTSVAHSLLSRLLPAYKPYSQTPDQSMRSEGCPTPVEVQDDEEFGYMSRYRMKRFGIYMLPVILSIAMVSLTMGLETIFFPAKGQQGNFILMSVTIMGILASFSTRIRKLRSSFRIGEYLLLVFCLALGTLIDFNEMLRASPLIFMYATLVMAITIFVNVGLAWIFRIDADTTMMTSAAAIYGPAFIGQIAMSMKNKEIVFSGMIASMTGIAIGNFLGLGMAEILARLM